MKNSSTQKKILFFMTSLQIGGGELVCVDLMNYLSENNYDVFLAVIDYRGFYKNKLSSKVKVFNFGGKSLISSFIKYMFLVWRIRPNILFSTYIHLNPFVVIASIFSFCRSRSVIRIGNPISLSFKQYVSFKDRVLLPFLTKITYPRADKIISVSRGVMFDAKKFLNFSEKNIQVIYSPKDYKKIKQRGQEFVPDIFLKYPNSTYLLFVGRLVEQKDPETLVRAMTFLKNENMHLVIVGGGGKEDELKNLAKSLDVFDFISFEGPQDNPYVYMKNSNIFVLPSLWEGMPNVLLESIAFDMKIVATDCFPGSAREFLSPSTDVTKQLVENIEECSNGFLVPVSRPDLFASAIKKAVQKNIKKSVFGENSVGAMKEYESIFRNY